jgi:hypothetical protein
MPLQSDCLECKNNHRLSMEVCKELEHYLQKEHAHLGR